MIKYDSASVNFKKGYAIDSLHNDKWGLVFNNTQMARILYKKEKCQKALPYAQRALTLAKELEAPNLIAQAQLIYGSIQLENGNRKKGITTLAEY